MKNSVYRLAFLALLFFSCNKSGEKDHMLSAELYRETAEKLNDVIVYDIFSPTVSSRIFAYSTVAAYEAAARGDSSLNSFAGLLNELEPVPGPSAPVDFNLSALVAFMEVGKSLIFSVDKMEEYQRHLLDSLEGFYPEEKFRYSLEYGRTVAEHIKDWMGGDNYAQTRTFAKYTITEDPGRWQPTPPAYMDAIEPHWNKIRPMLLDSANQFMPPPPPDYSMEEFSQFYKETQEVYLTGKNLSQEQRAIASFWDCNPFAMNTRGHFMFATKKISPGGHWMGICGIATAKQGDGFVKTSETYAKVAVALFDAFISCWDEKFRSSLVRPETVINRSMDEDWEPLLQTPPFPEYPSGHSVISSAAAVVLTDIYGDGFSFVDSVEMKYGLPAREFGSFLDASDEAAISRLYGGIHYRAAIEKGVIQGRSVGRFALQSFNGGF